MTRSKGHNVLDMLYQIEEPILNNIEDQVLQCLKSRKAPQLPLGIATKLNLNQNSVRGALNHLRKLNLVFQPLATLRIGNLDAFGKEDISSRKRQSYAARP